MAGVYSRGALVAKSFLYSVEALWPLVLASSARMRAQRTDGRPEFFRIFGGTVLLQLAGLAFVWVEPAFVIKLLCGVEPEPLVPLVRTFCAALLPLSLCKLVLGYELGRASRLVVPGLTGLVILYVALLWVHHGTPLEIVSDLAVTGGVALVLGLVTVLAPGTPEVVVPSAAEAGTTDA